uniref:Uncharacterized protein n=1 Tax=Rangifer tarandus platyrhynchus TaxID=3082113 RepID=A0ACB0FBK0_RANTA|nr:unnamed protein product [Rangifer tarandus platyrhynchus]
MAGQLVLTPVGSGAEARAAGGSARASAAEEASARSRVSSRSPSAGRGITAWARPPSDKTPANKHAEAARSGHAPPNPPPAGAPAASRFRGGNASLSMPCLSECRYGTGADDPQEIPREPPRPRQGPCSPSHDLSLDPPLASRPAAVAFPPADTPRRRDLGRPSAPSSGRFLAFRSVPDLSSPGTSRRRLEKASSSGQQQRPPRSLSSRRRSALSSAGVSRSHQPFHSSQQRKHVTAPAKTLSVTNLWPIRGELPPSRGTLGDVVATPRGGCSAARISRYSSGVRCEA